MLKNWSRVALASFLVLMVGASVASATTARVRSLANVGDYISDDSAVNRWYSTLSSYGNQVNVEMGQWQGSTGSLVDTRAISWNHACGEDAKYGTYRITLNENGLNHPGVWIGNPFYQDHSPSNNVFNDLGDPTTGAFTDTPFNKWDLAGAWGLGESMSFGVALTQSKWSAESTTPDVKASNSWLTIGGGISWSNNDNMTFDGAFNVGRAGGSFEDPSNFYIPANKVEWDSKSAFDVLGRLFYDWKDNVTLVPVAEFTTSNYSLTADTLIILPPSGIKTTDFMLGLGLNMDVNQDNMLVFAIEWMHRKTEFSDVDTISTTQNYLPTIRLSLESHVTPWLTTRVGAAKYLVTEKFTDGNDEDKATAGYPFGVFPPAPPIQGFDWFLGCGFTVAEWTIDLELNHETPFNLGYWLTGYSQYGAGGPVARISAAYNY